MLVSLCLAGCGGDDPATGGVVPRPGCLGFTQSGSPATGAVTSAPADDTSMPCDPIPVRLDITNVYDIGKVEFTVNFNASIVRYVGYSTAGSILGVEGTDLTVDVQEGNGRVSFVMTRSISAGGADSRETNPLMTLTFARERSSGFSSFSFSNQVILNGQDPRGIITGISWYGGTFRIG